MFISLPRSASNYSILPDLMVPFSTVGSVILSWKKSGCFGALNSKPRNCKAAPLTVVCTWYIFNRFICSQSTKSSRNANNVLVNHRNVCKPALMFFDGGIRDNVYKVSVTPLLLLLFINRREITLISLGHSFAYPS